MTRIISHLCKIFRNDHGSFATELAFTLPTLIIMCLSGYDIMSYYYYKNLVLADTQYYIRKAEVGDQDLNLIVANLKSDVASKLNIPSSTVNVTTKIDDNFSSERGEYITQDRPPLGNNDAGNDCFFDINNNHKLDSSLPSDPSSANKVLTINVSTKYRASFISIFGIEKIENINVSTFTKFQPYQNMKTDPTRKYGAEFCP